MLGLAYASFYHVPWYQMVIVRTAVDEVCQAVELIVSRLVHVGWWRRSHLVNKVVVIDKTGGTNRWQFEVIRCLVLLLMTVMMALVMTENGRTMGDRCIQLMKIVMDVRLWLIGRRGRCVSWRWCRWRARWHVRRIIRMGRLSWFNIQLGILLGIDIGWKFIRTV